MRHSLKFGLAAIATIIGGGSFYLGAAQSPAFAQATAAQTAGTRAQPATTTTERQTRRPTVVRPANGVRVPPGGTGGQVGPGVGPGPGSVALTAAECTSLGGQVIAVGGITCPRLNGPDGGGQICSVVYHGTSPDGQPLTDRRDTCITSLR